MEDILITFIRVSTQSILFEFNLIMKEAVLNGKTVVLGKTMQ